MMLKNNFIKYLMYAIGEILLVVIGILIALQINNKNEKTKQRAVEVKILKEMKLALNDDIWNLTINLNSYEKVSRALKIIKEQLPLDVPTNDSLAYAFQMSLFNNSVAPNIGAYETLKSKGIDLISNDSLRLAIIDVYEIGYKYYQDMAKNELLPETFIQEYCAKLFNNLDHRTSRGYGGPTMVPNNYKALQKDTLYITIINTRISQVRRALLNLKYNFQSVQELEERIETELDGLK